jgi:ectoine hydroxylase-related dioxygenase (phytanoyl-CoA dioxygenase family)
MLTAKQLDAYIADGFLCLRSLWSPEEMDHIKSAAGANGGGEVRSVSRDDGEGGTTRLAIWKDAGGEDALSLVARSARMVEAAQQCIGEEVYHWHTKVIMKEARTGGAWAWHQDYGYWYNDSVLYPRLISCYIAIDRATRENGCMQVLSGSHTIGRIDHAKTGDHQGADLARVDAAIDRHERVYCEMEPGDALFFHCNLLHRSDQNRSDNPRYALICCYNGASNSPIGETWQPSHAKINVVPNDAFSALAISSRSAEHEFLAR